MPALQRSKADRVNDTHHQAEIESSHIARTWRYMKAYTVKISGDSILYFKHPAFIPSFACALLYLTVLSFSGQMVTYLLSTGFTSAHVAVARTLSVTFEVVATWVGPWLMDKLGPVRAGLWFASWQMGCLFLGMLVFWAFADQPIISASGLVGGTILSRVGLWGFDLCTQIVIQEVSFTQEFNKPRAANKRPVNRTLKQRIAVHSLQWKLLGKACLSYAPTP